MGDTFSKVNQRQPPGAGSPVVPVFPTLSASVPRGQDRRVHGGLNQSTPRLALLAMGASRRM
jgi:hypothetical protein